MINILSWNIRYGRGMDDRVDVQRIVREAMDFADFDILCVQEVASGFRHPGLKHADGVNQFEQIAALLPQYEAIAIYAIDRLGQDGEQKRFGNLTLSRLPVIEVMRHSLPQPPEPEMSTMPRVALETIIETGEGPVRIINTHLEFYSARQRLAQAGALRDIYEHARLRETASAGPGSPFDAPARTLGTVLTGDFNFKEDAPEMTLLLEPFASGIPALSSAWQMIHPATFQPPTMGFRNADRWPAGPFVSDYFLLSQDLAAYAAKMQISSSSDASDHQPLLLSLSL